MTPLQKGMAKAYFKGFLFWGLVVAITLYADWPDLNIKKSDIIMWVCFPIIYVYDYFLRNRKEGENKPAVYWIDALKFFVVCLLILTMIIISQNNAEKFDCFEIFRRITKIIFISAIPSFGYFLDMKQNKK